MSKLNFIRTVKMMFICAFCWILLSGFYHPYFVSTTEINYNLPGKTIEITCRMFTDNLEDALSKSSGKTIDLLHPSDRKAVEQLMKKYINDHLKLKTNGAVYEMEIVGYEKEEDAVWTYLEIKKDINPKKIEIENSLLYELLPKQINMVHVSINGSNRKSSKVDNPDTKMIFEY